MNPGQRIELIDRCANALRDRPWSDIDFILEQHGLPTTDQWDASEGSLSDTKFRYVRTMLGYRPGERDELLAVLDDFLNAPVSYHPEDEPWPTGHCRVFLSHLALQRGIADRLKSSLDWWGFDGFVAHKDIDPGKDWIRVINAALFSCDALAILLNDGIKESAWCDQEVGVALGRGVPVVPVKIDLDPYGLAGAIQAVPWPAVDHPESEVAQGIAMILLQDKRSTSRATEAMVARVIRATSFDMANRISSVLAEHPQALLREQVARLRKAQRENPQVRDAWRVERNLDALEAAVGVAPTPDSAMYGLDEEPF